MGQNIAKEGIPTRRPNAYNSLTPRAEIITVGASPRAILASHSSSVNSTRANSANTRGFAVSPANIQIPLQSVNAAMAQNPYFMEGPVANEHFIPKPILRNRVLSTTELSNPELSIFSTIPTTKPNSTQHPEPHFDHTHSEYFQTNSQPLQPVNPSYSSIIISQPEFQTFGTMHQPPLHTEITDYYPQPPNPQLTTSVTHIPSTLSFTSGRQISNQLQLLSFIDQPVRNEGFQNFKYKINAMRIQKINFL